MGYQVMQEASGNFADVIAIGNNVMLDASGTVSDVIAIGKEALRDASGTFLCDCYRCCCCDGSGWMQIITLL